MKLHSFFTALVMVLTSIPQIGFSLQMTHQLLVGDSLKTSMDSKQTRMVKYTCPMHHEVVSDKPGKCPKCGMKLEKVAVELVPAAPAGHTGHMHDMAPEGASPAPPQSSDSVKTGHKHNDGMSAADQSDDCGGGNGNSACNRSSAGVGCAKASAGSDEL